MIASAFKTTAKRILDRCFPLVIRRRILDRYYVRLIRNFNPNKERDLWLCGKLIKKGDIVVDIGANIGIFTKFMSDYVGPTGEVHSFEPIRNTFLTLGYAVKKLGLKNVRIYQTALSNHSGKQFMNVPLDSAGLPNFYLATLIEQNRRSQRSEIVNVQTLDSVLSKGIGFIKCDVEGHEREVLEGARRIIGKNNPAMLIEVKCPLDSFKEIIKPNIYTAFCCDGKSVWRISKARPRRYENIFYLTHKHVRDLVRQGVNVLLK